MIDVDATELLEAQNLAQAAAAEARNGSACSSIVAEIVNVADADAVSRLAQQVFAATGNCHVLMNNAGTGLGGGPLTTDFGTMEKVMSVNAYGPIHGCRAFVPLMQASGEPGIIINTGSKQGITMPPGNLTYNMSKAALKVYTEGLEHDLIGLRREPKDAGQLRAVLLIPGWVNTSIAVKSNRAKASAQGETYDDNLAFFTKKSPTPMPGCQSKSLSL